MSETYGYWTTCDVCANGEFISLAFRRMGTGTKYQWSTATINGRRLDVCSPTCTNNLYTY